MPATTEPNEMLAATRTMQAAVLHTQREPLAVETVTLPDRLDPGQVFVRIHYSGICGSQLGEIDGVKGPDAYLPHLLGHEAGAVVLETGAGVRHVGVGDHVVVHWRKSLGIESATPLYQWRGDRLNAGWATTFSEYAIVSENRVTAIPKDFDLGLAALFGCPITTGLGVVSNDAQLKMGESILVVGTGGVGLSVIQGAAMVSAHPIIAYDRYANRLELARKVGATHTILAGEQDLVAETRRILGGHGADVVVEHSGDVDLIRTAYNLTQPQGRTLLVGVPHVAQEASIYTLPLHFGKVLTGSYGGSCRPELEIPRYIRLCEAGKLDLDTLVTDRFALTDINEAIDGIRSGRVVGRCLIDMGHGRNA